MSLHGLNYKTERHAQLVAGLARVEAENARRLPCPRCGLAILPEARTRHDTIFHRDSEPDAAT